MTGTGPDSKLSRLSNRQRLIVAGLWLLALMAIVAQPVGLRHLDDLNGRLTANPGYLAPSARWIFWGTMLPLAAATAALVLQIRWFPGRSRIVAAIGLVVLAPVDVLAAVATPLLEDDSVRLANGRRFVVSPDDHSYTFLNEQVGPFGLYWRRIDTPMMGPPAPLAISRDEKWLVASDGIHLTACYRILPDRVAQCPGMEIDSNRPDFYGQWRARSERISRLTGVRP